MILNTEGKIYYGHCAQNNYLCLALGDNANLVSRVIHMKGNEDSVIVVIKESTVFAVIHHTAYCYGPSDAHQVIQDAYAEYGVDRV